MPKTRAQGHLSIKVQHHGDSEAQRRRSTFEVLGSSSNTSVSQLNQLRWAVTWDVQVGRH